MSELKILVVGSELTINEQAALEERFRGQKLCYEYVKNPNICSYQERLREAGAAYVFLTTGPRRLLWFALFADQVQHLMLSNGKLMKIVPIPQNKVPF